MSRSAYDAMQVCLKGHLITDEYYDSPEDRQAHCDKCGSRTIIVCEECGVQIKGHYRHSMVIVVGGQKTVPLNCAGCGKPYPWRQRAIIKKRLASVSKPAKYVIDILAKLIPKS